MTKFQDFELIYTQLFNLIEEIDDMIDKEDYESAVEKMNYKDKLIKKLILIRKTVNLTEGEKLKIDSMNKKIKENDSKLLIFLHDNYDELGKKLKFTRKKVKIASAYSAYSSQKQGRMIDFTE